MRYDITKILELTRIQSSQYDIEKFNDDAQRSLTMMANISDLEIPNIKCVNEAVIKIDHLENVTEIIQSVVDINLLFTNAEQKVQHNGNNFFVVNNVINKK